MVVGPRRKPVPKTEPVSEVPPTYEELGIDKKEAAQWQGMAECEKTKSDRAACKKVSEHLGVPVQTVRNWFFGKVVQNRTTHKPLENKDCVLVSTLEEPS